MEKKVAVLLSVWIVLMRPAIAGQKPTDAALWASGSNISVRPNALGPLVENQNIRLMLKDGTYVEGRVLVATEEELQK